MDAEERGSAEAAPTRRNGQLIDFERAEVISPMIYPPQPRLMVSGQKPYAWMAVSLVPLMYVSQPQYWGIQVVGSRPAVDPAEPDQPDEPQITQPIYEPLPYTVELDLAGVTGTSGVEVIGATHTEKLDVAT
jgi:hypothetical protein